MQPFRTASLLLTLCTAAATARAQSSAATVPPDITVAADGTGDFTSVHAAVQSIPKDNHQRTIVFIKDGLYKEKVRIDAPFVTLRGQSRAGTRIEFPQLNEAFDKNPDPIGRAVVNIESSDVVLENLTIHNTAGIVGPHSFSVYGKGDRTVIVDCDVLTEGADTVSLWRGADGRYYHARCNFRGAVDFVCPRGWCYATDCTFFETKATAAIWHDGSKNHDQKFVLRNCKFDGVEGYHLARHHHDAAFYLLDCTFSQTMIDRAPYRVRYPLGGQTPTTADTQRNAELDKTNRWGERAYYSNCHRTGGDYPWHADNLASAPGSPKPEAITAKWTFAGTWDPESTAGPTLTNADLKDGRLTLTFNEPVTAKGAPRLTLANNQSATYTSGSGTDTLTFTTPAQTADAASISISTGHLLASQASATLRLASPVLKQ